MPEDLFKAAGIHHSIKPTRGKKSRPTEERGGGGLSGDESYGGYNLRTVIAERQDDGISVTYRPRSALATASARRTLSKVLETETPQKRSQPSSSSGDEDDDDYEDDGYGNDEEDEENNDDGDAPSTTTQKSGQTSPPPRQLPSLGSRSHSQISKTIPGSLRRRHRCLRTWDIR